MDPKTMGGCLLAAFVIISIAVAGCAGTPPSPPATPSATATPEVPVTVLPGPADIPAEQAITTANNRFAFDLYSRLGEGEGTTTNLFFSPFSISSALAITYEGAKGQTADEIRSVFHFPSDTSALRDGFRGLNAEINSGDAAYMLRTANALWAEKTYPFLPAYTTTAERYYGAKVENLDFINKPDASRITINRWVEEQTNDKIKDLLPAGTINPLTCLVITNAIYFKGTWVKQFDAEKTRNEDFLTAAGRTVMVPMMQRTDEEAIYRYTETDDLQLLAMPYEQESGRQLSMVVLLPKGDGLAKAAASLNADTLSNLLKSAQSRQVMVYFPKFKLETKYEQLAGTLASMGMPTAFTDRADFSGMDGEKSLFISDVIHQAFVDVNEEGTEAAAATAVVMQRAAIPAEPERIPVFRADHPFLFFIVDDESGTILFMGRITDPSPA